MFLAPALQMVFCDSNGWTVPLNSAQQFPQLLPKIVDRNNDDLQEEQFHVVQVLVSQSYFCFSRPFLFLRHRLRRPLSPTLRRHIQPFRMICSALQFVQFGDLWF
jgi:hypothetical protein